MAIFEFDLQKTYAQAISVEDIGNCAIRCTNPSMEDYYIVTQTSLGKTYILKFGPLTPDVDELSEDFELTYKKVDYKETTIKLEITKLINDGRKKINQAELISLDDALNAIPTADQFIPL